MDAAETWTPTATALAMVRTPSPWMPDETMDSDGDGVGDNADAFPMDATE